MDSINISVTVKLQWRRLGRAELADGGSLIPPSALSRETGPGLFCLALYKKESLVGDRWWRKFKDAPKPYAVYLGEAENLGTCLDSDPSARKTARPSLPLELIKVLDGATYIDLEIVSKAKIGRPWDFKPRMPLGDRDSRCLALSMAQRDIRVRNIELLDQ